MSYLITLADGSRIPFAESGLGKNVEVVSADKTLRIEDSGKTFILSNATGEAITLPPAVKGACYKFVIGLAFATDNWTITSTANTIQGNVLVAGAHVAGADENTISFVATAESIGDYVEITSDGTNWYVSGSAVTTGAITLTVV